MAGAGRRTFAPGEVLTASNVMNYLQDQAVMNFAGTAARGSAIGTAVAEGMVSYLADSNDVQVYDAAQWRSVTGLDPVVVPTVNYSGGTATSNNLGTISFSAITSIQFNNVFSANYDNYLLLVNITANSATSALTAQLVSAGTPSTASYNNLVLVSASDNTTTTVSALNASSFGTLESHVSSNTNLAMAEILFIDPFAARRTKMPFTATGSNAAGLIVRRTGFANHTATSYDGFKLTVASGNMTGTASFYGYKR